MKPDILRSVVQNFLGSYVAAVPSGAVTVLAAGTLTAGHLLAMRWSSTVSRALIRRVSAQFVTTTAFGAAQEVGCDLVIARSYTVAHTGGTSVDVSGGQQKIFSEAGSSLIAAGEFRVASTTALVGGTQTLDAQAIGQTSGFATAAGVTIARTDLFDAASSTLGTDGLPLRSPIALKANEGIVIRNTVLMGATGVGRWQFTVEWDEVTL